MYLIRKVVSALRLFVNIDKWPEFRKKFGENIRDIRLQLHGQAPFFYLHKNGFPYVVIEQAKETRAIYRAGQAYENVESAIMNAWLVNGDSALDCGANVGLFTALMANRVGPDGQVIAIEASSETFKQLSLVKEYLQLKNVELINLCVADKEGEVRFSNDTSFSEGNSILEGRESGVAVRASSLDLILSAYGIKPSLVKLDIEGAEPLAFKGWQDLFRCEDPPLLVFEVFPRGLQRLGFTPLDIFRELPIALYDFWHINFSWPNLAPEFPRGLAFPLPDPWKHRWPTHTNVIAVPKSGRFAKRRYLLENILS